MVYHKAQNQTLLEIKFDTHDIIQAKKLKIKIKIKMERTQKQNHSITDKKEIKN